MQHSTFRAATSLTDEPRLACEPAHFTVKLKRPGKANTPGKLRSGPSKILIALREEDGPLRTRLNSQNQNGVRIKMVTVAGPVDATSLSYIHQRESKCKENVKFDEKNLCRTNEVSKLPEKSCLVYTLGAYLLLIPILPVTIFANSAADWFTMTILARRRGELKKGVRDYSARLTLVSSPPELEGWRENTNLLREVSSIIRRSINSTTVLELATVVKNSRLSLSPRMAYGDRFQLDYVTLSERIFLKGL